MRTKGLAWKASAWVIATVLVVGSLVFLALNRSDTAQQDAGRAKEGVSQVDANSAERAAANRRLILNNNRLARELARVVRSNRRLLRAQARQVRANRARLRQQSRVLVTAGIAEMAGNGRGIRIRQGAVGAVGATGAAGAAARQTTVQELTDVFAPLLPPAITALCEGTCDGPPGRDGQDGKDGRDAPPPSQDQVTAAVLSLCLATQLVCTAPGPKGEKGEPGDAAPPARCDPALGYVCQPSASPAPAPSVPPVP